MKGLLREESARALPCGAVCLAGAPTQNEKGRVSAALDPNALQTPASLRDPNLLIRKQAQSAVAPLSLLPIKYS